MSNRIMRMVKREAGFTVIELLIVVAILGTLASVAGVSFGHYVSQGKTEAYATELHDVRVAVAAMLSESESGQLDAAQSDISDMDVVTTDSGTKLLSSYLRNIYADGRVMTGCTYSFSVNGTVTQTPAP